MSSKLRLDPAQDGYSAKPGPETLAVQLEGGKSRFRRMQLGAAVIIQVQWFLTAAQYDYLMAFYRLRTAHGSQAFAIDVISDTSGIQTYDPAHFVPDSLQLGEIRGLVYIVSAQIEVIPQAENGVTDLATITAYEASL